MKYHGNTAPSHDVRLTKWERPQVPSRAVVKVLEEHRKPRNEGGSWALELLECGHKYTRYGSGESGGGRQMKVRRCDECYDALRAQQAKERGR